MRTLIVSDLHLGSLSGADVLRRAELRAPLLEALADVERLVLLGDVLELRHGPLREAMAAARPVFEDLGRAMEGGEVVLVAGNHDHALIEPWLALRGVEPEPGPLALEQLLDPGEVSTAYAQIASWLAPARTRVAYPGMWVRPDVYATHGHYLDCHLTVPTLERLSVGAMSRLLGRPAASFDAVGDYEAMGAPVFAWRDAVARDTHTGNALNGLATVNAWSALRGDRGGAGAGSPAPARGRTARRAQAIGRRARRRALVAGFPLAVAALNRAGLGPLRAEVSTAELRRAGLRAMDEVAARLDLGDAHVVFGHTHRAGPLDGDEHGEWLGRAGTRLHNTGSWTYASIFLSDTPGESPYWPGSGVLVGDDGPPQLVRLLQDRTREQIRPQRA
ncbi:MAG TPA: metallophosphoesterase [Solirubrobacteraceae bacterium]